MQIITLHHQSNAFILMLTKLNVDPVLCVQCKQYISARVNECNQNVKLFCCHDIIHITNYHQSLYYSSRALPVPSNFALLLG